MPTMTDAEPEAATGKKIRVLMPSSLGTLGVEVAARQVLTLVIVPKGAERRRFTPFTDLPQHDFLDEVLGRLSEYLAGVRRRIELDYRLPDNGDEFARRVLRETARIPYGRTRSHQEIARAVGDSGAYRQVLATLMDNPLPLIIPCHRVVPARSGIGSWIGGTTKKRWLLGLESRVSKRRES